MPGHSIRSLSTSLLFAGPKGSWPGLSPMATAIHSPSVPGVKMWGQKCSSWKKPTRMSFYSPLVQILFPALLKVFLPTSDTAASSLRGPPCSISRHSSQPKVPQTYGHAAQRLSHVLLTYYILSTSTQPSFCRPPSLSDFCHCSIAAPTEQWVSQATSFLQGAGGHRGRTKMQHRAAFSSLNDHWLTTE